MERTLTENEKLRKAEEIYFRRNNQNISFDKKENPIKTGSIRKVLFNLLLMINIAIIIFCIQNKDFIFTEEFLKKCESYNLNISSSIQNLITKLNKEEVQTKTTEDEEYPSESVNSDEIIENTVIEESVSSTNEDVENLKNSYSFIAPLQAVVTSRFGNRESSNSKVTAYHTGIDLAADKGASIFASTEGIVELVSSEGDYGNHLKIRLNNVTTLYAHCSKILVEEGQIVFQGQKIAEVGSTGNSTGNHLHFEIRVDDRYVDPAEIISF